MHLGQVSAELAHKGSSTLMCREPAPRAEDTAGESIRPRGAGGVDIARSIEPNGLGGACIVWRDQRRGDQSGSGRIQPCYEPAVSGDLPDITERGYGGAR